MVYITTGGTRTCLLSGIDAAIMSSNKLPRVAAKAYNTTFQHSPLLVAGVQATFDVGTINDVSNVKRAFCAVLVTMY